MEIHALFKFQHNPYGGIEVDTTSGSGGYRELSPFILGPIDLYGNIHSENFENLWQFSKVYREHVDYKGDPLPLWYSWRDSGYLTKRAIRYPMGKGRYPLYSYWLGKKLSYIEARKQIYAPIYAENVIKTKSFISLQTLCNDYKRPIILRDFDAYDHLKEGKTLKDVINDPNRKCGHAFVLMMILTNQLEECLK